MRVPARRERRSRSRCISALIREGSGLREQRIAVAYDYQGDTLLNQVAVFDVATGKMVGKPIAVGAYPFWLQMAPNGDTLYVANENDGTVTVIDSAL